ncbi:MAG: SGNH/GDSL hydrolase family protein [Desulfobacterales bacterium]
MNSKRCILKTMLVIIALFFSLPCSYADNTAVPPTCLASTGDSISVGVDAERFGDNTWASWVNGYYGFWQWLFGLTDVDSHNQRISRIYRRTRGVDRCNYMFAEAGDSSVDLADQVDAILATYPLPTYVTVFIGQNDICRDRGEDITPVDDYILNVGSALNRLAAGLDEGATILVVGPVDVTRLYEVAIDKKALGIVDCEVLWFFSLFNLYPCYSVLGPGVDDVDRLMILRDYIAPYNRRLSLLVDRLMSGHPDQNIIYTNAAFIYPFAEDEVSDVDCFHPSAMGQTSLSEITWDAVELVFPRPQH